MSDFYDRNKIIINKIIIITVFIAGIYIFINYAFSYIAPFFFGYLLSLLLNPIASLIHEKPKKIKVSKGVAAFIALMLLFVIIGVVGTSFVAKIIYEARSFAENVPFYMYDLTKSVEQLLAKYHDLVGLVPEDFQSFVQNLSDSVVATVTGILSSGVKEGSANVVAFIPGMLLGILLSIISTFFFVRDNRIIYDFIKGATPDWLAGNASLLKKCVITALGGYYRAQILIGSIVGAICMTGLSILRYPYALFLGLIIIVLDALPLLGSGTVFLPWILTSLITGKYNQAIGLLIIYAVVFITRQMIEPRILGRQIGVHPLLTLMSIYIGLKVFGLFGVIIGPVITMTTKVILDSDFNITDRSIKK